MDIVTSWRREGIQQGKHEEALALVLRLLRRRVGSLAAADEEQMADVVTWLQAHQAPL